MTEICRKRRFRKSDEIHSEFFGFVAKLLGLSCSDSWLGGKDWFIHFSIWADSYFHNEIRIWLPKDTNWDDYHKEHLSVVEEDRGQFRFYETSFIEQMKLWFDQYRSFKIWQWVE